MAKCTVTKKVEKTYVLKLTEEEAEILMLILSRVGGDPATTKRIVSDSIFHALVVLEMSHPEIKNKLAEQGHFIDPNESIYFRYYKKQL